MLGRAALLVGLAAGYVLGARDGRERYEQIKSQATKVANDPRVQEKAARATEVARAKAPALTDKVAGKVSGRLTGTADETVGNVVPTQQPRTVDALDEDVVVVPAGPTPLDGGHHV
jgi:hypothetical protein